MRELAEIDLDVDNYEQVFDVMGRASSRRGT